MKKIRLTNNSFEATFAPECGMNLLSFKRGDVEVIDQSTLPLFEERFAGLGALIGPHFHHREAFEIPTDFNQVAFPHIQRIKKHGTKEPFSHGIARYVPWEYEASSTQIKAKLKSSSEVAGIPLRKLEGFDFEMHLEATLMPWGLLFHYSVESDKPSVIGFHTYYAIDGAPAEVIDDGKKPIPVEGSIDTNFHPQNPLIENRILLNTKNYSLHLFYETASEENSWQLFHPEGASYVCVEPLTAKNPRKPVHTSSQLEVRLEIY
ncbi:MAG: hypothetical protein SNF33_06480 [Candidatus Algichlamydia australiensis]|nr:hypothetical protein [Chlamydiales bacterium]